MSLFAQGLTELIFGGITGYVTNDIAIKSLFKPGGVVEETRDEFIKEISNLLEAEIITAERIHARLNTEEVQQSIKELLDQYFYEHLQEVFANLSIKEVEQGDQLLKQIEELLASIVDKEENGIALVINQLPVERLLTKEQIEHIVIKLSAVVRKTIEEHGFATHLIQHGQQVKDTTLEQLGAGLVASQVEEQGSKLIGEVVEKVLEKREEVITLAKEVSHHLAVQELLEQMEQEIKQIPFAELFLVTPEELIVQIKGYLGSDQGAELILSIAEGIVGLAREVEFTMGEILPENFSSRFAPLIQQQSPILVDMLIQWMHQHKKELESHLESAIDEVLDVEEGTKGFLLQFIRNGILENISEQFKVVDKLGVILDDALRKPETVDLIGTKISELVLAKPVNELVHILEDMGIDCVGVVGQIMAQQLSSYLNQVGEQQVEQWLATSMESIYPDSMIGEYGEPLVELAIAKGLDYARKEKRYQYWINQYVHQKSNQWLVCPLGDLPLWSEQYGEKGDQALTAWIESEHQRFVQQIEKNLEKLTFWELAEGITDPKKTIQHGIHHSVAKFGDMSIDPVYQKTVIPLYRAGKLEWNKPLQRENWSDGLLAKLAEENMNKLSDEQVLELVQDFMGKELKPLNYLGAALGSVAGLGTGLLLPDIAMASTSAVGLGALVGIKAFIFGAVGYGTNCVAVKGLFWPYRPLWGKSYIQGVIPKRQKTFSQQMGKVIEERIFDQQYVKEKLEDKRELLVQYSRELIQSEQVQEWLNQQTDNKSAEWAQHLIESMEHQLPQLVQQGMALLANQELADALPKDKAKIARSIVAEIIAELPQVLMDIAEREERFIQQHDSLISKQLIHQLDVLVGAMDVEKLQECVLFLLTLIEQQTLGEIASKEQLQKVVSSFGGESFSKEKLSSWLQNGYKQLANDYTLEELVGIRIERLLEEHQDVMFNFVMGEVLVYLKQHQDQLTGQIQQEIEGQLGFMQLIGYQALNGPQLIVDIVTKVIEEKVPTFLHDQQSSLMEVVHGFWGNHLSNQRLDELEFTITEDDFTYVVEKVSGQVFTDKLLSGVIGSVWKAIEEISIKELTSWLKLDRELGALASVPPMIQQHLIKQFDEQQDKLIDAVSTGIAPWMVIAENKITPQNIFGTVTEEQWSALDWNRFFNVIGLASLVEKQIKLVYGELENQSVNQWLDLEQIEKVLIEQMQFIMRSEQALALCHKGVDQVAESLWENIPLQTKEQLVSIAVHHGLDLVSSHSGDILAKLHLGQLATETIQAMNPEQLEAMVKSFADPYFAHIQRKGWLGAIFSLPGIGINLIL